MSLRDTPTTPVISSPLLIFGMILFVVLIVAILWFQFEVVKALFNATKGSPIGTIIVVIIVIMLLFGRFN